MARFSAGIAKSRALNFPFLSVFVFLSVIPEENLLFVFFLPSETWATRSMTWDTRPNLNQAPQVALAYFIPSTHGEVHRRDEASVQQSRH